MDATSTGRWLGVAALSATASSLATYAVFRWQHSRDRRERLEAYAGAAAATPHRQQRLADEDGSEYAAPFSNGNVGAVRDPYDPSPRTGYLSWDDYFMAVAFLSAQRSKDPNKQVGACIVDRANVICGIGYNGFPRGCPDSRLPWAKRAPDGDPLRTKYPYVCHAEMNAILNKNGASVAGARVFVTMFPCNECAKLLIQAGIAEIVYHEDKAQPRAETPAPGGFKLDQQYAASKLLLSLAGVRVRQHLFTRPVALHLSNHASTSALLDAASDGAGAEDDLKDDVALEQAGGAVSPALAAVLANAEAAAAAAGGSPPATGKLLLFDEVAS